MAKDLGFLSQGIQSLKDSAQTVGDDVHMLFGTPRGKMKEEYLQKKYNRPQYNYEQRLKQQQEEGAAELLRESRRGQGMKKGGKVSSASKRADGIAQRGKTRGRMI